MTTVYRLLARPDWERARADGVFRGSAHDQRDGYIHFSTADQVAETARKYYAGVPDLWLLFVRIDAIAPTSQWRWEPSRGGALFPHLYGVLPVAAVHRAERVSFDARGEPQLPSLLP